MEESTFVNKWIAKGEARGEARGKRLEAQATILRLGTKKFGDAPAGVQTTLGGIDDQSRLDRIMDRVFDGTATGWDDLLATP